MIWKVITVNHNFKQITNWMYSYHGYLKLYLGDVWLAFPLCYYIRNTVIQLDIIRPGYQTTMHTILSVILIVALMVSFIFLTFYLYLQNCSFHSKTFDFIFLYQGKILNQVRFLPKYYLFKLNKTFIRCAFPSLRTCLYGKSYLNMHLSFLKFNKCYTI